MLVIEMHKIAKESNKYSSVLRRDWALNEVDAGAEVNTEFGVAHEILQFDGADSASLGVVPCIALQTSSSSSSSSSSCI